MRRTGTVRVLAADLRFFASDVAGFCHIKSFKSRHTTSITHILQLFVALPLTHHLLRYYEFLSPHRTEVRLLLKNSRCLVSNVLVNELAFVEYFPHLRQITEVFAKINYILVKKRGPLLQDSLRDFN